MSAEIPGSVPDPQEVCVFEPHFPGRRAECAEAAPRIGELLTELHHVYNDSSAELSEAAAGVKRALYVNDLKEIRDGLSPCARCPLAEIRHYINSEIG